MSMESVFRPKRGAFELSTPFPFSPGNDVIRKEQRYNDHGRPRKTRQSIYASTCLNGTKANQLLGRITRCQTSPGRHHWPRWCPKFNKKLIHSCGTATHKPPVKLEITLYNLCISCFAIHYNHQIYPKYARQKTTQSTRINHISVPHATSWNLTATLSSDHWSPPPLLSGY